MVADKEGVFGWVRGRGDVGVVVGGRVLVEFLFQVQFLVEVVRPVVWAGLHSSDRVDAGCARI